MYDFRKLASLKHLCACGLVLLGLGNSFPVIAATKSQFNTVPFKATGSTAQIGAPGSSVTAFPGTGNVSPVSGSGWYTAGNYGVAPPATGATMYMAITGDVAFSGVKYPWQAGYNVPKSAVVSGAAALLSTVGGPYTAAALFAAPYLLDWLTKSGGRIGPDGSIQRSDPANCFSSSGCQEWRVTNTGATEPWRRSATTACNDAIGKYLFSNYVMGTMAVLTSNTSVTCDYTTSKGSSYGTGLETRTVGLTANPLWLPSSMNDISPYMAKSDVNPDGRVIQELLDKGASITMPAPTVTGPASIVGSETTTVNPDGTKSVSKTTYNFNTSGDTITNTSNVTTTNNYNTSNVITGTTTTTATPVSAETKPSECDKNPNSNGCRTDEFDTPTQEIPKSTRNVTFTAENLGFAGGACPADKFMTPHGMAAIKVYDWAGTCDKVTTYAKPMILALATFAALMIIFVGKPE